MSLVADIAKSYWAPGVVVATRLRVVSEPQALATLMGACLLIFVGQWPVIARAAFLDPEIELSGAAWRRYAGLDIHHAAGHLCGHGGDLGRDADAQN